MAVSRSSRARTSWGASSTSTATVFPTAASIPNAWPRSRSTCRRYRSNWRSATSRSSIATCCIRPPTTIPRNRVSGYWVATTRSTTIRTRWRTAIRAGNYSRRSRSRSPKPTGRISRISATSGRLRRGDGEADRVAHAIDGFLDVLHRRRERNAQVAFRAERGTRHRRHAFFLHEKVVAEREVGGRRDAPGRVQVADRVAAIRECVEGARGIEALHARDLVEAFGHESAALPERGDHRVDHGLVAVQCCFRP